MTMYADKTYAIVLPGGNGGEVILADPGSVDTGVRRVSNSAAAGASAVAPTFEYTPQDIVDTYAVLAPMATDYANANLERAGQAQASYGPLAQAAMGGSQTAGIGNYTYNRLVRPAVDTMRDQLIVEGYSAALNKQLSDSLNAAKRNYNRATRKSNPSTDPYTPGSGQTKIGGYDDVDTGAGSSKSPLVLYNTYTITDADGNSKTYRRPEIMKEDQEWYNWVERQRKRAEAEGKTFKYGS